MPEPGQIALMIPIFALCIPLFAIHAKHKERLEEIKSRGRSNQSNAADESLRAEMQQLKDQVMALRETTTKFDLSFDAALDGIEERVKRVEERQLTQSYQTSDDAQRLMIGR